MSSFHRPSRKSALTVAIEFTGNRCLRGIAPQMYNMPVVPKNDSSIRTVVFLMNLIQYFSVGLYDFLIPVEGILTISFISTIAIIVCIDIDETIAFFHFACACRYDIDR